MIDFLYAGEVEVPEADLSLFLATAGELKIRGLTKYAGGVPALATRTLDTADTEAEDNIVIPSAASGNLHKELNLANKQSCGFSSVLNL